MQTQHLPRRSQRRPWPVGWAAALGAGVALGSLAHRQWRAIAAARAGAARAPAPYSRPTPAPAWRILVLGDSTGVGLGADPRQESIAAWLARDFPGAHVINRSACGARVRDLQAQAADPAAQGRWDLVLVLCGGNDVLRRTPARALAADADALLRSLRSRSDEVVWAGVANLGLAPIFLRPLGWWLSLRTRRAVRILRARC